MVKKNKVRFKGKVVEITKKGELKEVKKKKLSPKQLKEIAKKFKQLENEKLKQKKLKEKIKQQKIKALKIRKERLRLKPKDIKQLSRDVRGLRQLTAGFPVTKRKPIPSTIGFVPERQDFQNPLYQPMLQAIDDIEQASIPTIRAGFNSSVGIEQSANLTLGQADRESQLISDLLSGRL